jgi:hypothetical protein
LEDLKAAERYRSSRDAEESPRNCDGYAVELREELDKSRLAVLSLILLLISSAAGVVYSAAMRNLQNGEVVFFCLTAVIFRVVQFIESSVPRRFLREDV